jgi:hypothetical protein
LSKVPRTPKLTQSINLNGTPTKSGNKDGTIFRKTSNVESTIQEVHANDEVSDRSADRAHEAAAKGISPCKKNRTSFKENR